LVVITDREGPRPFTHPTSAGVSSRAPSYRSQLQCEEPVYNAIWFTLPAVALAFAAFRPAELRKFLGRLADSVRRREREVVVVVFAALGGYLVGKGVLALR